MISLRRVSFVVAISISLFGTAARAQVTEEPPAPLPDPQKFARGLYAEGELGAVSVLGRAPLSTGIGIGVRVGYDLFRVLAVQLHLAGSTHQGSFGSQPQQDQLMQLYTGTLELKGTYTLRQVSIFFVAGMGMVRLSSNLLATAGLGDQNTRTSLALGGGAGIDYHTLTRHFSFGLRATYYRLTGLDSTAALAIGPYLRYTF